MRALAECRSWGKPVVSFRLQSRAFPPRGLLRRATKLFCVLCPLRHLAQHLRAESP
jgi:hypothetical protein